jgi:hypothetical protein
MCTRVCQCWILLRVSGFALWALNFEFSSSIHYPDPLTTRAFKVSSVVRNVLRYLLCPAFWAKCLVNNITTCTLELLFANIAHFHAVLLFRFTYTIAKGVPNLTLLTTSGCMVIRCLRVNHCQRTFTPLLLPKSSHPISFYFVFSYNTFSINLKASFTPKACKFRFCL